MSDSCYNVTHRPTRAVLFVAAYAGALSLAAAGFLTLVTDGLAASNGPSNGHHAVDDMAALIAAHQNLVHGADPDQGSATPEFKSEARSPGSANCTHRSLHSFSTESFSTEQLSTEQSRGAAT